MFCRNCGKEIEDDSLFCTFCGTPIKNNQNNNLTNTVNDSGSFLWAILAFFLPIVGLILCIMWNQEKPKTAKKLVIGTIVGFIFDIILSIILSILIGFIMFSNIEWFSQYF